MRLASSVKTAPQTSSPTVSTICLCFCDFPYFITFSIKHSYTFHIWKCVLYHESIAQHHHQQWAPSPIFSCENSPYFNAIFHLEKHLFIFRSAHWTLKTVILLPTLLCKIYSKAMPAQKFVVEKEETCGTICAKISQFGRDQKGTMYTLICIQWNAVVVQWIASLKWSPWSGVQFSVMPLYFLLYYYY